MTKSPAKWVVSGQAILRVFRMGGIGRDYQRGWAVNQSAAAPCLRRRSPGNAREGTRVDALTNR